MRETHGWWFPDIDTHFPKMLQKNVDRGGPAEYQQPVRMRSMQFVKTKRTALDIGANVGLWSRDLVKHFDQVIAFEPVAIFRECLLKNVAARNLQIMDFALGEQETNANMIITAGNTGHSHLDPDSMGTGNIRVLTLDSLALDAVDYIKVDCEGFEYRVLQGAQQTITAHRPIVVVEQKPHQTYSSHWSQHAAVDLLLSWGMRKLDQVKDDWIMGW